MNGTVKWRKASKDVKNLCDILYSWSPRLRYVGYVKLFTCFKSSIEGNLKQWPMNSSYELLQVFPKKM